MKLLTGIKIRFYSTILATLAVTALTLALSTPQHVNAISYTDFQAGNIISDNVFTNTDVSAAEIQKILENQVPTCDTKGEKTSPYYAPDYDGDGRIERWEYGKYKGNPAPFTCLKDYYENPTTKENNYGGKPKPSGAKSAAQLIIDAGKKYNISPRVLVVTLKKESSLIHDDWPFLSQFQYAMGAHCPDGPNGANCDPDYAGFSIQMNSAAKLFRYYLDNMNESWWPYKKPGKTQDVWWDTRYDEYTHPSLGKISCNDSRDQYDESLFVANKATAALYTYTPYQPNSASLKAYPSAVTSGNSFDKNCATYGNRNFWFIYSNWFGSTQGSQVFRINSNEQIYLLSGDKYFHVPDVKTLKAFGYDAGDVLDKSDSFLNGLTKGEPFALSTLVRFGDNPKIYIMDQGKKRWFPTHNTLVDHGFSVGQETVLDTSLEFAYSEGKNMTNVLLSRTGQYIWWIDDGVKHHLSSGYYWNKPSLLEGDNTPIKNIPITLMEADYVRRFSEGYPLITTYSLLKSSDSNEAWYKNQDTYYRLSNLARTTWSIKPDYEEPRARIEKITGFNDAGPLLGVRLKSNTGNYYLIDGNNKYRIDNLGQYGVSADDFGAAPLDEGGDDRFLKKRFKTQVGTSLVSKAGDPKVYQIKGGELHHVYSKADFESLGFKWDEIMNWSASKVNWLWPSQNKVALAEGRLVRKDDGTGRVYLLSEASTLSHIPNLDTFNNFGFSMQDVIDLNVSQLESYSAASPTDLNNQLMKSSATGKVYLIDRGVRRWISSDVISELGKHPNDALTMSSGYLQEYKPAKDLTLYFKADGGTKVYKLENGQKRWFTSQDAFLNNGGDWSDVRELSAPYVKKIPTGSNID